MASKIKKTNTHFRSNAFIGNCLFNTISRFSSATNSIINNQNINNQNNNCQQQQYFVVQAGVSRGGNP